MASGPGTTTDVAEITIRDNADAAYTVASVVGELRADGADDFAERLHPLVAGHGARLLLDLSRLERIDSAGLSCLLTLGTRARLSGGRMILVAPMPMVAGVLEVTRLDTWFEIAQNLEEAERRID